MFKRPVNLNYADENFGTREVGVTHPDNNGFMRIRDNGNIEIFAGEGVGIIFSTVNRSVTIVGDTLKVLTKEEDGFRWNKLSFNSKATNFTEPAFLVTETEDIKTVYRGIDDFID